ncbi:Uracil-DNA glycosylase [Hypsizygus marmoreus]|uniref:Uracil-DNA glycosylase n=1 Tax=Hypsizygus marmoreus TaxID=39966 RepID=A0A369JH96_HYPMA|nr:Uracil-DNA glycosylase [Hypsizygus marmoreus]
MPKDTKKPHIEDEMIRSIVSVAATSTGSRNRRVAIPRKLSTPKKSADVRSPVGTDVDAVCITSMATVEAMLSTLENDTMEPSWFEALQPEFKKPYFLKLKAFLLNEHKSHTVYPPLNDIYSWSMLTPLEQVKVIILGQDPYHNIGQAHGLSFSVLPPTKPPGSLKNIYKQLSLDFPSFIAPMSGDLSPIAKLGVLWLNTSLTVRAHKAASHANKGWETFTAQAIRAVMNKQKDRGIVFMAWGLPAQKTCTKIGIDEEKHLVLRSAHPSPLSAHKGFIGNGHFQLANDWLKKRYGKDAEIDWTVLSDSKE